MRRLSIALSVLVLLVTALSCSKEPRLEGRQNFGRFFAQYGVTGSFVLFDPRRESLVVYNDEMAERNFPPCSTFKIVNSLLALDSGAVSGPDQVFRWDGKDRGDPAWNRDLTMKDAFRSSAVWVFQQIADGMGRESIRTRLSQMNYGNAETSGPAPFWINGDLRISALGQVDFLRRLSAGELVFSDKAQKAVKDMMVLENDVNGRILRGKTGMTEKNGLRLGWFVGWVEKDGKNYPFALNILSDHPRADFMEARQAIVREILKTLWI